MYVSAEPYPLSDLNALSTFFMKLHGYYNIRSLEAYVVFLSFAAYRITFIGRNVFTTLIYVQESSFIYV
jgi:hypothetical protein